MFGWVEFVGLALVGELWRCGGFGVVFLSILPVSAVSLHSEFSIPALNTRLPFFHCLPAVLGTSHVLLWAGIVFAVLKAFS